MARDEGHDYADKRLRELAAAATVEYAMAENEAKLRLAEWAKQFEEEDERRRKAVLAGEMSEKAWKAWRADEMSAGARLSQLVDEMARLYTRAAETCAANVSAQVPGIAAENANWAAFAVSQGLGMALPWTMVDSGTIGVLIGDAGLYLPEPRVNVDADIRWNRQKMKSAVTQGILLGDPMDRIADRLEPVTGMCRASAVRLARTSVTAAENAGRVATFENAKALGVEVKKEWLATLDGRTRYSHRHLDGEKMEVGGTFSNGLRYPGDPQGSYAEACNCRCTLVAAIDGVDTGDAERWSRLPDGMTYAEWKRGGFAAGETREKHVLKSGRYAYSQEEIDEVMERRGIRLNTVVPIMYNPRLGTPGITRYQIPFPGFYHVTSIEIGPQKNGEENELIDSILHEALESKLLARGDKLLEGGDKTVHPYIDKIIARYAKMKGLW